MLYNLSYLPGWGKLAKLFALPAFTCFAAQRSEALFSGVVESNGNVFMYSSYSTDFPISIILMTLSFKVGWDFEFWSQI